MATIATQTDNSFPSDHILRMAATIAKTATKRRIDPKSALELGAMTDQPHDAKLQAKPTRVRTSPNRAFDSTVEALAVSIASLASLLSRSLPSRLLSLL